MIDPETQSIRFVSDGFKDNPQCSWACLIFLIVLVLSFTFFTAETTMHVVTVQEDKHHYLHAWAPFFTGMAGAVSIVGFSLVVAYPVGTRSEMHLSGAALFIIFYTVMQVWVDVVMWCVHKASHWSRMIEYGIFATNVVAFIMFSLLMVCSIMVGGQRSGLTSGSAVAEYMVFASFLGLNIYGMSRMTFIASWYVRDPGTGQWVYDTQTL